MMKVLIKQFESCPDETSWTTCLENQDEQFSLSGPQQSKINTQKKNKKYVL